MHKQRLNQSGAAMIMFAMIMMVVLTLITIGFAFLVRNDQRQTLDKTLSNQAQYAAETVANRTATALLKGTLATTQQDCGTSFLLDDVRFPELKVTCVNWTSEPEIIKISNVKDSPKSVKIAPKTNTVTHFAVKYTLPAGCTPSDSDAQFLNTLVSPPPPPVITVCPYLKIALSDAARVYSATGRGQIVYSRPQTDLSAFPGGPLGNLNTFSYPLAVANAGAAAGVGYANQTANNPSGEIDNTFCNNGVCVILVRIPDNLPFIGWAPSNNGLVAFSAIGGPLNIEIAAYTAFNPASAADWGRFFPSVAGVPSTPTLPAFNIEKLVGVQAQVDVTAKSTDVIRRISVAVPIGKSTWTPGFAVNANSICKNFKLDGINTDNGPAHTEACY